jgi:hypothetical protein
MSLLRSIRLRLKHPGVPEEYRPYAESDKFVLVELRSSWVVIPLEEWRSLEADLAEAHYFPADGETASDKEGEP